MTVPDTDDRLARRARAAYLAAGRELDPLAAARLRAGRLAALDAGARPDRPVRLWLPAGAFAAAALAALLVWQPHPAPHAAARAAAAATADGELPPDADSTDPQLYQNLDFYDWLATADRPAAGVRR